MEIIKISDKKDLSLFVNFINKLYKPCNFYNVFTKKEFKKRLKKLCLKDKTSTALIAVKNKQVIGRILYSYQCTDNDTTCLFSFFDCINNKKVSRQLFAYIFKEMEENNINNFTSSWYPFENDLNNGILIDGFDNPPTQNNSYNYEYYNELLEDVGLVKLVDSITMKIQSSPRLENILYEASNIVSRRYNLSIKPFNNRNYKIEMEDIKKVFHMYKNIAEDNNDINELEKYLINLKSQIDYRYFLIAREIETNEPIGFVLCLPEYNQLLIRTKGRYKSFVYRFKKNKVSRIIGNKLCIIPRYQNTELAIHLCDVLYKNAKAQKILEMEIDKLPEGNNSIVKFIKRLTGSTVKVYRTYKNR